MIFVHIRAVDYIEEIWFEFCKREWVVKFNGTVKDNEKKKWKKKKRDNEYSSFPSAGLFYDHREVSIVSYNGAWSLFNYNRPEDSSLSVFALSYDITFSLTFFVLSSSQTSQLTHEPQDSWWSFIPVFIEFWAFIY